MFQTKTKLFKNSFPISSDETHRLDHRDASAIRLRSPALDIPSGEMEELDELEQFKAQVRLINA